MDNANLILTTAPYVIKFGVYAVIFQFAFVNLFYILRENNPMYF